jgi:hypothetical protein
MTGLEIQKLRIENATSNPTVASGSESVFKGRVFYNSSNNKLYYYNGTTWQATGLVSITLGGDLSGTATTDVDGNVTLNATVNANSIALGTDTTGNYVATVASSGGTITVTGSGSETAAVNVDLPNTGVTAGSYGSQTAIPTFTVDAQGRLTAAGTVTVATTLSIAGDTGTDTVNLLSDTLTFAGTDPIDTAITNNTVTISAKDATYTTKGVASFSSDDFTVTNGAVVVKNVNLGSQTTGNYVAGISGTTNEIEVSGSGSEGASVTIGLPNDVTITNNLTVGGNLNVTGTINSVNTTQVNIVDNKVNLNTDFTGTPVADAGIRVERGAEADVEVLWNETNDNWTVTNDGTNYHAIARKYTAVIGDGSATSIAVTHNLGSRDVTVQVYDASTYESVETGVARTSTSAVTLTFAVAPSAGAYRVVITG